MLMNWDITDEEKLLRQSAVNYFREKLPINHLRKMRDSQDQVGFHRENWKEMAELGWTGILIPEEFGGMDFGFRGLGLIMEAAGRHLSSTPLLSTALCASRVILQEGSHEQRQKLLPAIAAGEWIIAVAHDEGHQHGSRPLTTTALSHGSRFTLKGQKSLVLDLGCADQILVLARTTKNSQGEEGLSWFLVDVKSPGLGVETFRLVDGRPASRLNFQNVELGQDSLLGTLGSAGASYEKMRQAAAGSLAAEMLGSSMAAFEMTLAYLKERKQFGVAIGSFQALQHRMANLYSELEVSKSIVHRSLCALDAQDPQMVLYTSLAKAKLSELFQKIAAEAIQLHGGIGMTDEHSIGFFLKRSRISAELFGNAGFHRDRYASAMNF